MVVRFIVEARDKDYDEQMDDPNDGVDVTLPVPPKEHEMLKFEDGPLYTQLTRLESAISPDDYFDEGKLINFSFEVQMVEYYITKDGTYKAYVFLEANI